MAGARLVLQGSGFDGEDGFLDGDALVWTSSVAGPLGTGGKLVLNTSLLANGVHEVSLVGKDSDDNVKTAAAILIEVLPESLSPIRCSPSRRLELVFYAIAGRTGPLRGAQIIAVRSWVEPRHWSGAHYRTRLGFDFEDSSGIDSANLAVTVLPGALPPGEHEGDITSLFTQSKSLWSSRSRWTPRSCM